MKFIITQLIGMIGFITISLSYYKKQKKQILFTQIIAYIMFTVHYFLLSGITGAVCNLIGLIAFIIIYLFEKYNVKNKNILIITIIPFLVVIALITYENIFSIFPIVASVIAILSFLTDKEDTIRIIGVISAACWLIYAIVYKSYIAIVFEVITFISTAIALIKNAKKK